MEKQTVINTLKKNGYERFEDNHYVKGVTSVNLEENSVMGFGGVQEVFQSLEEILNYLGLKEHMENTLENKSKFFALYLSQHVVKWHKRNSHTPAYLHFSLLDVKNINKEYLELKPLSSISDEDAIEVARLCGLANACIRESTEDRLGLYDDTYILRINYNGYIYLLKSGSLYHQMTLRCYDFLRSKGYALPWMGLSVEEQVNRGWVKLKEETK